MKTDYGEILEGIQHAPSTWLVTGAAGFIGSHLAETLLKLDQTVIGLDSFATGSQRNIETVSAVLSSRPKAKFRFVEGDIRSLDTCREACKGADYVLHQAALASVPGSIADPVGFHQANANGFLNVLTAARDAKARRVIYASSSAIYGDSPGLPKEERVAASPLSPYAATKCVNELYAEVFARCYGLSSIGLRYFNIFGPRQDPHGAYAAVIPKWISAMIQGEQIIIYGDGETSRDFCYVGDAVQANLLAAVTQNPAAENEVYNVATGKPCTLNGLYAKLRAFLPLKHPHLGKSLPEYKNQRDGDIRHSLGDIAKASDLLGYKPQFSLARGLECTVQWYAMRDALIRQTQEEFIE